MPRSTAQNPKGATGSKSKRWREPEEGQKANNNGDEFELAGLYYTIALFFAGLALVFKSKMRWGFAGAGVVVFLVSTIYLLTRTWA